MENTEDVADVARIIILYDSFRGRSIVERFIAENVQRATTSLRGQVLIRKNCYRTIMPPPVQPLCVNFSDERYEESSKHFASPTLKELP